jgi:GT2 family glycosyltransferase
VRSAWIESPPPNHPLTQPPPAQGEEQSSVPLELADATRAPAGPALPDDVPVSIVVATRDRPDDLRACLESLRAQETRRPVEIVVVDNHPASGLTAPVVAGFPGVVLLAEERAGSSYARNAGFAASRGAIVVSADDDVVVPPGWLERLIAPFARPEVAAVTGNVLPLALDTPAQRLFEDYGGLGRGFRRREFGRAFFDRFRRRAVPTWDLGATANAAFRAACFADPDVGLLEETLGAGMPTGVGEDTYLFYRLLKAGRLVVYEPAAWVWHRHRREMADLRRQLFAYSRGHVAYHLLTLLRDGDPRALLQLAGKLPWDHARRLWRRLRGRSAYPARLVLLEIAGNLLGPWALWAAWLRVRQEGRSAPYVSPDIQRERREPALQP